MSLDSKISFNLSAQSIMVNTTQMSDRSWSANFCVIVYSIGPSINDTVLITGSEHGLKTHQGTRISF